MLNFCFLLYQDRVHGLVPEISATRNVWRLFSYVVFKLRATNLFLIAPYIYVEFMKTEMPINKDAVQPSIISLVRKIKFCQGKSRNVQFEATQLSPQCAQCA